MFLEPTTASQALQDPNWCAAMDDELVALARNHTWVLVPPPSNHNIVGCKLVFRIKRNLDGSISRYKACLVAKGFHQCPGLIIMTLLAQLLSQPPFELFYPLP